MSEDRDRLLKIMSSLEADYRSGKISADKYSYFRSKYEDKLNTIDAEAATRKIRSMQGKSNTKKRKRSKRPTNKKKQEEQDLVQKYIINPKKGDARYNKAKKSSMDSGTFKLLLLLVLVIGFTAGVAYGVFNFDFDTVSQAESVATVQDTAFPEFNEVLKNTSSTNATSKNSTFTANYSSSSNSVETTTDSSNTHSADSSTSSASSSASSSSQSGSSSNNNPQSDSNSNPSSTTGGGSTNGATDGGN